MANVTVRLNLRGINALMSSPEVQRAVDIRGKKIAEAAGENFEYVANPHKYTARGHVQPVNREGMREEAVDKKLTRSLDAER